MFQPTRQTQLYLLSASSALLMLWAIPPQRQGWLAWIALVPLLVAIASAATLRQAFAVGWLFGTLMLGLSWNRLHPALQSFEGLSPALAWPLFAMVIGQAALAWALFAGSFWQLRKVWPAWPMAVQAPILLTCAEFLVPGLFHFHLGLTQAAYPWITQVADFSGVVGVSFLIAMFNGCLYDVFRAGLQRHKVPWRALVLTLTLMAAALGYSHVRIGQIDDARRLSPKLRIGVVQSNISVADANNPALSNAQLARHFRKSRQLQQRGAELIVWPETTYPFYVSRHAAEPGQSGWLQLAADTLGVPLLVGAYTVDSNTNSNESFASYNSAVLVSPNRSTREIYDKHLLLPVSEYIPFSNDLPWLKAWFPTPRVLPGTQRTALKLGPHRIGALICLEDLNPGFVRGLVPLQPNLLVTLGSDARFGADSVPQQHLAMAQFRSIEMRLDMVRAFYNGISAIIDANGRVQVQTRAVDPEALPGVRAFGLTGTVALLDGPRSFYACSGDVFAWLNLLLAFALLVAPPVLDRMRRRA